MPTTADPLEGLAGIQVVILARGEGSRLRPFTLTRPKALCPVCNVPVLSRLLRQLQAHGFTSATVALPLLSDEVWQEARATFPFDLRVDSRPSGHASKGSIPAVLDCLDPQALRVLVIYGDSLLRADLAGLVELHQTFRQHGGAATLLYHRPADRFTPERDGRTYHGILSLAADGRVTRFVEKPPVSELHPGFDLANAAVFVVERSVLEDSARAGATDFSRHLFEPAVREGRFPIYGAAIGDGYRHDVGSVARLLEANAKVLAGEWAAELPGEPVAPGIWQGRGCSLAEATLTPPVLLGDEVKLGPMCRVGPGVVLGNGCEVGSGAVLRNAVLLQDCKVGERARVESSVLGARCQIGSAVRLPPYSALGDFTFVLGDGWPSPPSPSSGGVL